MENTKIKTIILTDFGTLFDDSKDYFISDFIKLYNEKSSDIIDFYYDEENNYFILKLQNNNYASFMYTIIQYNIKLSKKQQEQIEHGNGSEEFQTLMMLTKKQKEINRQRQIKKNKEEICKRFDQTGEYPSSIEGMKLYAEYIEKQLKETKAAFTFSCRCITVPFLLAINSTLSLVGAGNTPDDSVLDTLFAFTFVTSTLGLFTLFITGGSYELEVREMQKQYRNLKMLYYKYFKLQLKCKQLGLLKEGQSISELPAALEDDFIYEVPSSIKI